MNMKHKQIAERIKQCRLVMPMPDVSSKIIDERIIPIIFQLFYRIPNLRRFDEQEFLYLSQTNNDHFNNMKGQDEV